MWCFGDRTALPAKYQAQMNDIEEKTRGNTGTVLNVAVNYGGRQEIVPGDADPGTPCTAGVAAA